MSSDDRPARLGYSSFLRRGSNLAMRGLARQLIRVFFRRVEVEGIANLPASGPVVMVANHQNGLVDGLLLMSSLARYPRFLGKTTLFSIPMLWPFLKMAGVIPVQRHVDTPGATDNASAFAASADVLAAGEVVAVFPEGISHDEAQIQPLRTGAARIALEASMDVGLRGVVIVPVGLVYDAKARFRSRALVRVGIPLTLEGWESAYEHDRHEAVRGLTAQVATALGKLSPAYDSWAQAQRLSRVAEVLVRPFAGPMPADNDLADVVQVADRLRDIEHLSTEEPSLKALWAAYDDYARDLALLGLSDAQVVAHYSRRRLWVSLAWSLLKVVVALPAAGVGLVVHVLPFQIIKAVAKRPSNEGIKATVKLGGCFVLFTLVYAAIGIWSGLELGVAIGLAAALGAPLCGYVTVRLVERVARVDGLVKGYRIVKERRNVLATVYFHRGMVIRAASELAANP